MDGNGSVREPRLKVGYILKMFPRLSETFILNEVLGLERQGVETHVFSLMYPNDGRFHGRLAELERPVEYIIRDRVEAHWQLLRELTGVTPAIGSWQEVADFFSRNDIPKHLELLFRSVRIAHRVEALGIQHLHAHFATIATRVAAAVSMLTGVPFSFTSHAKDIFRQTVNRDLYKQLVDRAAFNITVSDFNRNYILDHTPGVDASKIVRLYNGIDLDYFARNENKTASAVPRIVSVGRLVPKKGFDVLLDAVASLRERGQSLHCTIVGGGEDEQALHNRRDQLGLRDMVHFTGAVPQEQVRRLVARADLSVLACVADELGNMDALPTTLLESLALGVPIVSTNIAGVPEIVGAGCGVVVEPASSPALAGGIEQMLERINRGEYVADDARARAEKLFSLPSNVGQLAERFSASAKGSGS